MHISATTLYALGLALLTGFFSGTPVLAQSPLTLNSGDSISVTGAGTAGVLDGQPVANSTDSYSDGSTEAAVTVQGSANFLLGDGATLSDYNEGSVALYALGSGQVTVAGGTLDDFGQYAGGIDAVNGASVNFTGGDLDTLYYGFGLAAGPGGTIAFSGGNVVGGEEGYTVLAQGAGAQVFITGGSITGPVDGYALDAANGGVVNVTGGAISAGTEGNGILVEDDSTINLFSLGDTPFLVDGVAMNNTSITGLTTGTIQGTLASGELIDTTFSTTEGTINLNVAPAPELTTASYAGLGLIGWAVLALGSGRIWFTRHLVRSRRGASDGCG